jgi:hypothetical protein
MKVNTKTTTTKQKVFLDERNVLSEILTLHLIPSSQKKYN